MKDKFNEIKRKVGGKLSNTDPKQALDDVRHKAELAASINEQLVEAASHADRAAVTKLLLQGADINHKSPNSGNTALALVLSQNDTALAEFLLDHGADPRIDGKNGPALCCANARLVPRLLELGCNPNAADHYGTPLLRLTLSRDGAAIEAVKALLDHGAEPNARGFLDATPLGNALFSGSPAMVSLLLKAGAAPYKNQQGRYPEIIAAEQRYMALEQMDRYGFLPGDWPTMAECRQCLRLVERSADKPVTKPGPRGPKAI